MVIKPDPLHGFLGFGMGKEYGLMLGLAPPHTGPYSAEPHSLRLYIPHRLVLKSISREVYGKEVIPF
jgi:hypothetical protein